MSSDIKTTRLSASGSVIATRARCAGVYYVGAATAGTIQLRDGGASGSVLTTIDTPASATATEMINFPGRGVVHETDIYATLTNVGFVTVFYEG